MHQFAQSKEEVRIGMRCGQRLAFEQCRGCVLVRVVFEPEKGRLALTGFSTLLENRGQSLTARRPQWFYEAHIRPLRPRSIRVTCKQRPVNRPPPGGPNGNVENGMSPQRNARTASFGRWQSGSLPRPLCLQYGETLEREMASFEIQPESNLIKEKRRCFQLALETEGKGPDAPIVAGWERRPDRGTNQTTQIAREGLTPPGAARLSSATTRQAACGVVLLAWRSRP